MRRIRSILVTMGLLLALLSVNPVAAGGGGSTFDFSRRWFAPGQMVVGTTQFTDGIEEQGRVADGPYFAYLVPGETFIDPPRLPRDAIRLGRVRMRRQDSGIWAASIRFVVPNVRPGTYTVSLCNDPCRNAYVGDLMGAWISIATSAEQAKIRNLEDRIADRVFQQTDQMTSDLYGQLEQLRESVDGARAPSITVGTELRLAPVEDQIERLNAQVRTLEKRADQGMVAWLWMAGWIVAAGLAVAWRATVVRRRRSAAKPHPSEPAATDGVMWNEVPPPVFDEGVWQPDRHRNSGELVSR